MQFYLPTKIYTETGCVKNHSEELASLGKKALIITGRTSSKKNGSLKDVEEALKAQGREYCIFDKIEENPSIEMVMEARDYGLEQGADYCIGIGGGSPLDAAKAAALMMANPDADEGLLYEAKPAAALPVAEVPTTCGTGSEVTPYAVITIHKKRTKSSISHRIYPVYALIDGSYLKEAPLSVIANTAIDALGHMIESYCNTKATDYSRMSCKYGMEMFAACKDVITGRRIPDEEDYVNLMNVAAMAGIGITHTGTTLPHALSYKLTYELGIPHGKAVGILLAAYLKRTAQKDQDTILAALGMASVEELRVFITEAIGEAEVLKHLLEEGARELASNTAKLASCPFPVNEEELMHIYEESCVVTEQA